MAVTIVHKVDMGNGMFWSYYPGAKALYKDNPGRGEALFTQVPTSMIARLREERSEATRIQRDLADLIEIILEDTSGS